MKHGSIFKRYIKIYSAMLLSCTAILGIIMMLFTVKYVRQDKMEILSVASDRAIEATIGGFDADSGEYILQTDVEKSYEMISETTDVTVFFVNTDGNVVICSEKGGCVHSSDTVPQKIRSEIDENGQIIEFGSMNGFYDNGGHYTCGTVVKDGESIVGYVLAELTLTQIIGLFLRSVRTFLIAVLIMLTVSSFIIYRMTKKLSDPIEEMSKTAESFSQGNFGNRVSLPNRDDEIGRLADNFNRMADSLESLESTRRSFVANVSHELRTPMTTIGGYIDGIRDGTIPLDEQGKYLEIVSNEIKRLSRLTTSLLGIARMEAGEQEVKLENQNVWDIIINVMLSAERRISGKNIEVSDMDPEPCFALCDGDMLHQVIYNLIDNAIKFTPEYGTLTVRVYEVAGRVNISIRNSGEGVDAEELNRIFDRFYKTDKSRSADRVGVGLGLYIVKTLTGRMNGTITADSVKGEYTQFTLSLQKSTDKKDSEKSRNASWRDKLTRGFRKDGRPGK